MNDIRLLRADEIDCRVSTVSEKGCSLLLYKDARVDQNILDETFGRLGWQRHHRLIGDNLYCTVSIWDNKEKQWVDKEDVGTESYTEKEKGQASDSFKRACFNIGIGRELYTAPFIWIGANNVKLTQKNGKYTTYDKFLVKSIGYDDKRNIVALEITNEKGKVVYTFGKGYEQPQEPQEQPVEPKEKKDPYDSNSLVGEAHILTLMKELAEKGITIDTINRLYNVTQPKELTMKKFSNIMNHLDEIKANQDEFEKEVQEAFK